MDVRSWKEGSFFRFVTSVFLFQWANTPCGLRLRGVNVMNKKPWRGTRVMLQCRPPDGGSLVADRRLGMLCGPGLAHLHHLVHRTIIRVTFTWRKKGECVAFSIKSLTGPHYITSPRKRRSGCISPSVALIFLALSIIYIRENFAPL
jgi:hypothetical protein